MTTRTLLAAAATATGAALAYYYLYGRRSAPRRCLAVALGGSSDIVGVLALALARGYDEVVLVQPGSPAKGAEVPKLPVAQREHTFMSERAAPGGDFFNNATMLRWLMRRLFCEGRAAVAGYYVVQPKDDGKGFSKASFETTTELFAELCTEHEVEAIVALDFGGDVALDDDSASKKCYMAQRDLLNTRAAAAVAERLGLEATIVAAAPGVDAAGVDPAYLAAAQAAAQSPPPFPPVRVLEMDAAGELVERTGADASKGPPACVPPLPPLPHRLYASRMPTDLEGRFCAELRSLAADIAAAVPDAKRSEHFSKTYWMMTKVAAEAEAVAAAGSAPFVAIGQFREAEKARAHLHSSTACGLFDVAGM